MQPSPLSNRALAFAGSFRSVEAARWRSRLAEIVLGPIARAAHFPLDVDASLVAVPGLPVAKRGAGSPPVNQICGIPR